MEISVIPMTYRMVLAMLFSFSIVWYSNNNSHNTRIRYDLLTLLVLIIGLHKIVGAVYYDNLELYPEISKKFSSTSQFTQMLCGSITTLFLSWLYQQKVSDVQLKEIRLWIIRSACILATSITFYTGKYPIHHGWTIVYFQSLLVGLTLLLLNMPSGYNLNDKFTTLPLKVLIPISISIFTHMCSSYDLGEFTTTIEQKTKFPVSMVWIYWTIVSSLLWLELYQTNLLTISTKKHNKENVSKLNNNITNNCNWRLAILVVCICGTSCLLGNISDNIMDVSIARDFSKSYNNSLTPWWIIITYIPIVSWSERIWSKNWTSSLNWIIILPLTGCIITILYYRYIMLYAFMTESDTNIQFQIQLTILQTIEKLFFEVIVVDRLFSYWITSLITNNNNENDYNDKYIAICDIVTRIVQSVVVLFIRQFGYENRFNLMKFVIIGTPVLFIGTFYLYQRRVYQRKVHTL